ncbi:MAG: diacylglycerol kinase family lipid kinase [Taibaiella sp.]|nr:diacylglycerol kinase family lipid kinase [Taibaiella sp.]
MKHLVFIINPKSGVVRQKAIQQAIDTKLDAAQFTYEIKHTEYAKHGTQLAKDAAEKGAYAVVAVGGDGSVNDIVAGLIGTNTALAIIPKGSGNGMARTMEIPLQEEAAIEVINRGKTAMMDIGYANDRPFISNAGVAFDALISRKFAKSQRRGFAMYSWLVTRYMWTYKEWEWDITIDGQHLKEKAFIISIASGKQFGYNFQIAPNAIWNDGIFDVIIIKRFPKVLGGMLVLRAMNGTITDSPFVDHYRAKEITIYHPKLRLMQTDGDAHGCTDTVHFRIEKGKQKVIVP